MIIVVLRRTFLSGSSFTLGSRRICAAKLPIALVGASAGKSGNASVDGGVSARLRISILVLLTARQPDN